MFVKFYGRCIQLLGELTVMVLSSAKRFQIDLKQNRFVFVCFYKQCFFFFRLLDLQNNPMFRISSSFLHVYLNYWKKKFCITEKQLVIR